MSTKHASPRCPICNEPTDREYQPFCSKRCADVDLNRWLSGSYAIPGEPVLLDDEIDTDETS